MASKKYKGKYSRDAADIDEAYYGMTGRKPKPSKNGKTGLLLGVVAAVVLPCVGLVAYAAVQHFSKPKMVGRVSVAGIDMSGMTREQAESLVDELAQKYSRNTMQVSVLGETVSISPEQCGISLSKQQLLDAVYAAPDSESLQSIDILPYLNLDEPAIWQAIMPLKEKYGKTPSKTTWQVIGDAPTEAVPAGSRKLVVTIGVPDYGLDADLLFVKILDAYRMGNFSVTLGSAGGSITDLVIEPEMPDLDEIYSSFCTESADAVMDPVTFEITPESDGYAFDLEAAKAALADCDYGEVLEFPFAVLLPQVTEEALAATLYCDVLGEYKTPHTADSDRNVNLKLACEAIHNMILLPGETFSYNKALGERTEERGYKPAESYVNGLTVDTVGGGICQVSSTLYYCALLSDMEIKVRYPHGYVSSYIPKGMDASVTWNSADFKFVNTSDFPIRIEAWMAEGYVHIRILGTDERSYYVKLDYEELESYPYDTEYREYAPNNPEGYSDGDIIITPYTGCKVKTYKKLYDKDTDKLMDKVYITTSTYNTRNKVICIIVDPTPPETDPPETQPPETTPAETQPAPGIG